MGQPERTLFTQDAVLEYCHYAAELFYRDRDDVFGQLPYVGHLAYFARQLAGAELPAKPTRRDTMPVKLAFINVGRWLWRCGDCNSAVFIETGADSICPACMGEGWVIVEFPAERAEIEEEILKQPGRRSNAPIREWRVGWSLEFLRERTRKANELKAKGRERIRALSIGSTRAWAVGEVVTAANMNTFESDLIDDLAGRNGEIQLEGPLKINDGSGQYLEVPTLTTTQRDALTAANGMVIYNSTLTVFQRRENAVWISYTDLTKQTLSGFTHGDVVFIDSGGVLKRLAAGTAGQVFTSQGSSSDPTFTSVEPGANGITIMIEAIMYG